MRKLLQIVLIFNLLPFLTFGQNVIDEAIKSFAVGQGLEHASISFSVVDLSNGSVISQYNSNTTLPTASTAKLFSTATALEILGPSFRPLTRVYIDGNIDSAGILQGNVWIRGAGDPSLGSKYFNKPEQQLHFLHNWVDSLKSLGITQISGNIIGDASEFGYYGAPGGWNWSDLGNYYGAGPSGLTIYDNLLEYTFSCPSAVGRTTLLKSINPTVPGLIYHNYVLSSERKGDNAYLFGAPYSLDRFGTGTLPAGATNFMVKGSLPDPEDQFAYEFHRILKENGIVVLGEHKGARTLDIKSSESDYNSRILVITQFGEKLINVIDQTNLRSVNLFAEHMINLIGYDQKHTGTTDVGLNVLSHYWSGKFNTSGMNVTDGSGLSRTNSISATHFTSLLSYMNTSKYAEHFKNSLPVAGVSGTLRNVCKGQTAQNRIKAKSGSMTRIKSYAGYAETISGKNLAFALIVNNADCSSSVLKRRMEILFNKMVTYK